MAKTLLRFIICLIYFFNVIFAQFEPALTILSNSNLTTSCKAYITSLIDDKSVNKCLPMFTIITTIPQLLPSTQKDPKVKLSVLAQLVQQTCSLSKCSSSLVQNTALTLQDNCSQDLLQQNIMATLNLLLFSHYKPIQELICKRDNSKPFNPYCILETLANIGTYNANLNKRHEVSTPTSITNPDPTVASVPEAANPATSETPVKNPTSSTSKLPVNGGDNNNIPSSSLPSSFKTLEALPNSLVCTDCNKAMVSVVLNYLKENPAALNGTQIQPVMIQQGSQILGSKCGSSFLDASIPETISGSSKLLYSYFYNFIEILVITISLLS